MATQLRLEEQVQLDQIKDFWKQYGNLVTWLLILGLGALAAFGGWRYWQDQQAAKAAVLFDDLERAVQAGDLERTARAFKDMTERYPRTTYAEQAGLLAAKAQAERNQPDAARASLQWVIEHADEPAYQAVARLRLAGLLIDQKKYEDAAQQLAASFPDEFKALAADRRGDLLQLQGKKPEALAAYQEAYKAMAADVDYRKILAIKLTALGAPPAVEAASAPQGGQ